MEYTYFLLLSLLCVVDINAQPAKKVKYVQKALGPPTIVYQDKDRIDMVGPPLFLFPVNEDDESEVKELESLETIYEDDNTMVLDGRSHSRSFDLFHIKPTKIKAPFKKCDGKELASPKTFYEDDNTMVPDGGNFDIFHVKPTKTKAPFKKSDEKELQPPKTVYDHTMVLDGGSFDLFHVKPTKTKAPFKKSNERELEPPKTVYEDGNTMVIDGGIFDLFHVKPTKTKAPFKQSDERELEPPKTVYEDGNTMVIDGGIFDLFHVKPTKTKVPVKKYVQKELKSPRKDNNNMAIPEPRLIWIPTNRNAMPDQNELKPIVIHTDDLMHLPAIPYIVTKDKNGKTITEKFKPTKIVRTEETKYRPLYIDPNDKDGKGPVYEEPPTTERYILFQAHR